MRLLNMVIVQHIFNDLSYMYVIIKPLFLEIPRDWTKGYTPIEPHSLSKQEDNCWLLWGPLLAGIIIAFSFISRQKEFDYFSNT